MLKVVPCSELINRTFNNLDLSGFGAECGVKRLENICQSIQSIKTNQNDLKNGDINF